MSEMLNQEHLPENESTVNLPGNQNLELATTRKGLLFVFWGQMISIIGVAVIFIYVYQVAASKEMITELKSMSILERGALHPMLFTVNIISGLAYCLNLVGTLLCLGTPATRAKNGTLWVVLSLISYILMLFSQLFSILEIFFWLLFLKNLGERRSIPRNSRKIRADFT
ncbi:MAG: hypothetical protein Q4C70_03885 [Planctomycetia bacterium]|nr:hypothetical protein [Planctomycetia bacterium]